MRMRGELFRENKRLWGELYCQHLPQQKVSPDDEGLSTYTSHLTSNLVLIDDVSDVIGQRHLESRAQQTAIINTPFPHSPSPPPHTHTPYPILWPARDSRPSSCDLRARALELKGLTRHEMRQEERISGRLSPAAPSVPLPLHSLYGWLLRVDEEVDKRLDMFYSS